MVFYFTIVFNPLKCNAGIFFPTSSYSTFISLSHTFLYVFYLFLTRLVFAFIRCTTLESFLVPYNHLFLFFFHNDVHYLLWGCESAKWFSFLRNLLFVTRRLKIKKLYTCMHSRRGSKLKSLCFSSFKSYRNAAHVFFFNCIVGLLFLNPADISCMWIFIQTFNKWQ